MKRLMMTAAVLFAATAVGCSTCDTRKCDTDKACAGECDGKCGGDCAGECGGACKDKAAEHAKMCPDCKDGKMCDACKAKHS